MAWRTRRTSSIVKFALIAAILGTFLVTIFLGSSSLPIVTTQKRELVDESRNLEGSKFSGHRLAVIVPFRERFEELLVFAPFMQRFLNANGIEHEIVIVNQIDQYRFNRASLINVGFQYATSAERQSPCDYIVMHDVDLLPLNADLPYGFPEPQCVTHVAAPGLHPKYNYSSFIGGILVVPSSVFRSVDGMSNVYWGWGLEDDEFFVRLKQNAIKIVRPSGIRTDQKTTFRHLHSAKKRPRDHVKCYGQYNKTRRRDRLTGLRNVNYTLESVSKVTIDTTPITVLNVQLHCNTQISPWCDCSNAIKKPSTSAITSTTPSSTTSQSSQKILNKGHKKYKKKLR